MNAALTVALLCLTAANAPGATPNPYLPAVSTLYAQTQYAEALTQLEKAMDWRSSEAQELIWLKLMRGVLLTELSPGEALQSFREALSLDGSAQLPVKGSRRSRRLFEQARGSLTLSEGTLEEEAALEPAAPAAARGKAVGFSPRRLGWNLHLRGEVDVLGNGLDLLSAVAPVVGIGYSRVHVAGLLGVLVQSSPGLRAEARLHPFPQSGLRPYVGVGATAFFRERNRDGTSTFFGGVSGRGVLGVEVPCTSRLYGFADVAYERFLQRGDLYRANAVLLSLGVGLFP